MEWICIKNSTQHKCEINNTPQRQSNPGRLYKDGVTQVADNKINQWKVRKRRVQNSSVLPYFFPFEQSHNLSGLLSPYPALVLMLLVQDVVGIIAKDFAALILLKPSLVMAVWMALCSPGCFVDNLRYYYWVDCSEWVGWLELSGRECQPTRPERSPRFHIRWRLFEFGRNRSHPSDCPMNWQRANIWLVLPESHPHPIQLYVLNGNH